MELIFKRFTNVLSVLITVGIIFAIGNFIIDRKYNDLPGCIALAALCFSILLAINYICFWAQLLCGIKTFTKNKPIKLPITKPTPPPHVSYQ